MAVKGDVPPSPGAARLVARVVDPSVREDGVNEPVLELAASRGALRASKSGPGEPSSPEPLVRGLSFSGHPVRDRLLARALSAEAAAAESAVAAAAVPEAASAGAPPGAAPPEPLAGASEAAAFSSLPPLADDLDLIGARRGPEPRPDASLSAPLSSSAALLLGTLFGVVALATLFAVLIHVAPRGLPGPAAPAPVEVAAPDEVAEAPSPSALLEDGWIRRPPRKPASALWRIEGEQAPELSRITGSLGGRSFLDAAREAGLAVGEGFRAMAALKDSKNLDKCRPSDSFIALVERATGKLKAFEYLVSPEEVYQAREGQDGLLHGGRLNLKLERQRVLAALQVRSTFEDSARRVGFEPGVSQIVDRALEGYARTNELSPGDSLRMVVQERSVLGSFSRYTGIEAIEYRPRSAEPIRLYYFSGSDVRGYVDQKGRRFGRSRWINPVKDVRITSRFNPKRFHPVLRRIKPHNGTDFAASIGTPVMAAASGVVRFMGPAGPNGNLVKIDHAGGYETGYSHLSRFAKGLKVGTRITQRQLIGYSGTTGRSTGPHLHFSAKKNGRFIDPETLRLDEFTRLPQADRELMAELRRRYDQLLDTIPVPRPLVLEPRPLEPRPAQDVAAVEAPSEDDEETEPGVRVFTATASGSAALAPPSAEAAATTAGPAVTAAPSLLAPAGAAPASTTLSTFLSDGELQRRQPATHSGEVEP